MNARANFITTYQSISGWNAVQVWWNPEHGGFWEPWDVRRVQSADEVPAILAAKEWAAETGLEYRPREST
jgi:hypothetical protein